MTSILCFKPLLPWQEKIFGPTLLTKEGTKPTPVVLYGKKIICLYVDGSWNPANERFTPILVRSYNEYLFHLV